MARAYDLPDGRMDRWAARNTYLNVLAAVAPEVLRDLRSSVLPSYSAVRAAIPNELSERDNWLALVLEDCDLGRSVGDPVDAERVRLLLALRTNLRAWGIRWHMSDRWCWDVALGTLHQWHVLPELRGWKLLGVGYWTSGEIMNQLLTQSRTKVEQMIRSRGAPRKAARQAIEATAMEGELIRSRARKNSSERRDRRPTEYDGLGARAFIWLARAAAGVPAPVIAEEAYGPDSRPSKRPDPAAILLSNKRLAGFLGLTFRPRRGRPKKTPEIGKT
jgi:hypothetical protein